MKYAPHLPAHNFSNFDLTHNSLLNAFEMENNVTQVPHCFVFFFLIYLGGLRPFLDVWHCNHPHFDVKGLTVWENFVCKLGMHACRTGRVFDVCWLSSSFTSVKAFWEIYPALSTVECWPKTNLDLPWRGPDVKDLMLRCHSHFFSSRLC